MYEGPTVDRPAVNKSLHEFCDLTVDYIKNNCLETYINVNVHFFVGDDCEGLTAARKVQDRLPQGQVYQRAEDFIETANEYLAEISENQQWNQAEWDATVTDPQCVVLRFVLDEVHIHCETQNLVLSHRGISDDRSYYTDSDYNSGLNIFVADVAGSPNGFAQISSDYVVVEDFRGNLISHEVGHALDLQHNFLDGPFRGHDRCGDTPDIDPWAYDQNGDGITDDSGLTCWTSNQTNGSGVNLCEPDGSTVVNAHPCCDLSYGNNNVMTYSSAAGDLQRAAFTPCQMHRMLDNLLETKCDLIEEVNPACPPVSAFIGVLPGVDFTDDCSFELYFQASSNEDDYRLTYQIKQANGYYTDAHQTDWLTGPATSRITAVGTNLNDKLASSIVLSNTTYRVVLETRNTCGTDIHAVEFTTGNCDLRDDDGDGVLVINEENIRAFPNPTYEGIGLEYTTNSKTQVAIFLSGISADGNYTAPIKQTIVSGLKNQGKHSVNFSKSKFSEGINYIIIQAGKEVHLRRIVQRK